MTYTLGRIGELVGGRVVGDAAVAISGVGPLASAEPGQIAFLASAKPRYLKDLAATRASAVVLADAAMAGGRPALVVDRPAEAFDRILALFPVPADVPPAGVHPAACVDPSAQLGEAVAVGAGAVVQSEAAIGPRTVLWPNVFVGRGARIGADCILHPGAVLREGCELGDRVIVHPNAVIGADGFGYRQVDGRNVKVPQVGRVVICDDVEIGANTTIDRAKFGATRVGAGAKIDNLCQIAHNVQIGEHCVVMALCGIAGSSELGDHVMLAGQVGVRDNIRLGDRTVVTACSCAARDFGPDLVLGGRIAKEHRVNMREMVLTARLPELFDRVRQLEQRLGSGGPAADNP